jgi:hypothetical protein
VPRAQILGVVAIAAMALAYALPVESVGCAQNSHYAATRSFAYGHPYIDSFAQTTCDLVRTNGHYYAAKAPAMDFWTAPWFRILHKLGAVPPDVNQDAGFPAAMVGVPQRAIWQMGLWAVVVPAILLLLLVRRTVDRIEPGLGLATAAILGLATLVFPFSALLFAHVPATLLAFLSFTLLFDRPHVSLWRAAAAGAAAGLAASTDLPFAVPAVAVGLYAAWRHPRVQRLFAFGAGGVVGLIPLLGFDTWAFGNPFHLAYSGAALDPGAGGVEQASGDSGFFTLHLPSFRVAVELLLSQRGLLVLTPVVGCGIAGCVLLWRRGYRAESVLIVGLSLVELTWNSAHNALSNDDALSNSLGGWVPGPRFLIALLPFLCFALAPVLRRAPATVGVLALVSMGGMTVATSAEPLLSSDDTRHWLSRIADGNFTNTVISLGGAGHGWLAIIPFYVVVVVALVAVVLATPLSLERRDLMRAGVALVAWILVEHAVPQLLRVDRAVGQRWGLLATLLVVAAAVWSVVKVRPEGLIPLLPLATVHVTSHTKVGLLLGLLALAALALTRRLRRVPGPA